MQLRGKRRRTTVWPPRSFLICPPRDSWVIKCGQVRPWSSHCSPWKKATDLSALQGVRRGWARGQRKCRGLILTLPLDVESLQSGIPRGWQVMNSNQVGCASPRNRWLAAAVQRIVIQSATAVCWYLPDSFINILGRPRKLEKFLNSCKLQEWIWHKSEYYANVYNSRIYSLDSAHRVFFSLSKFLWVQVAKMK